MRRIFSRWCFGRIERNERASKEARVLWCAGLAISILFPWSVFSSEMVTFLPQWVPQAQFVGYYVACHVGIYERVGLRVTILDGGVERPSDEFLADERVEAASLWLAQGIHLRDRGVPVVNIGQMVRHSGLMLVARKSSGITSLQDLQGKRVSLWESTFGVPARALLKKHNITVRFIPQGFSVNLFLRGGADVTSVMVYNEYFTLLMSGLETDELTVFPLGEMGLDFPEDGLYVLEESFLRRPQVWKAFVEASLEGWRYAFAHPEEALDVIMDQLRRAHVPASRVHQRWMLEQMRRSMGVSDENRSAAGVLREKEYRNVAETLHALGVISSYPSYEVFYRGRGEPNGDR